MQFDMSSSEEDEGYVEDGEDGGSPEAAAPSSRGPGKLLQHLLSRRGRHGASSPTPNAVKRRITRKGGFAEKTARLFESTLFQINKIHGLAQHPRSHYATFYPSWKKGRRSWQSVRPRGESSGAGSGGGSTAGCGSGRRSVQAACTWHSWKPDRGRESPRQEDRCSDCNIGVYHQSWQKESTS
jgi:hypothetical protein